eukprot:Rmarinus@m.21479
MAKKVISHMASAHNMNSDRISVWCSVCKLKFHSSQLQSLNKHARRKSHLEGYTFRVEYADSLLASNGSKTRSRSRVTSSDSAYDCNVPGPTGNSFPAPAPTAHNCDMHGADESPPVLEPAPAAHDCDMTGVDQFPPVPEPASAEHDCNAPGPTGESLPVLELAPAAHDCNVPGPGEVPVDSLQPSPLLHLIEQGRINPGQQNDECCSMLSQLLVSLNHTYSVQQTAIDALVEGLRDNIFPSLELCIISRLCAEVSIIRPDLGCIINDVLLKSYLRAKQVAQNEYNSISERVLHMAHSRYFQRKWTFPPDKKSLYTPEVYKLHEGRLSYGKSLLDSIHVLCQGSYFSNAFLEGLIELKSRAFQPAPDIITDLWDTAYVRNLVSERFNRAVDNEEDVDYDLCLPVLYYFDDIDLGSVSRNSSESKCIGVSYASLGGLLPWVRNRLKAIIPISCATSTLLKRGYEKNKDIVMAQFVKDIRTLLGGSVIMKIANKRVRLRGFLLMALGDQPAQHALLGMNISVGSSVRQCRHCSWGSHEKTRFFMCFITGAVCVIAYSVSYVCS